MTKSSPLPSRQPWPSATGTPPTNSDGSRPASSRMCASSEVVVVLPCVPATTIECLPSSSRSPSTAGNDVSGMPRSWAALTSTWSLPWTLPTTTSSGPQSRFCAPYGIITGTPSAASCSLIGGYTAASEPRTSCPAAASSPATAPIPVPPMPIRCTFTSRGATVPGSPRRVKPCARSEESAMISLGMDGLAARATAVTFAARRAPAA